MTDPSGETRHLRLGFSSLEQWTILQALEDYAEDAGEASADKRQQAESAEVPAEAEGLDAEADFLEREHATAVALIERVRQSGSTDRGREGSGATTADAASASEGSSDPTSVPLPPVLDHGQVGRTER